MNEHYTWPANAPAPFRRIDENQLDRLKNQLLRQAVRVSPDPDHVLILRRAANEAAALAWLEPFPLLAFPELFEEKAMAALRRHARQTAVRVRSAQILPQAA